MFSNAWHVQFPPASAGSRRAALAFPARVRSLDPWGGGWLRRLFRGATLMPRAMQMSRCPPHGPASKAARAAFQRAGRLGSGAGPGSRMLEEGSGQAASRCLPRKEVIQPHLPVRLPCYDFTPLTLHTFDASAPEGFGRRLRVQTTRVV